MSNETNDGGYFTSKHKVNLEREMYTISKEFIDWETAKWGHNLSGWMIKTTKYFIWSIN